MGHTFRRLAGAFHYEIKTFADLQRAADVPVAHWIASACPTTGLNCDPKFLEYLDTDGNHRVRAEELKAGIAFTGKMLKATDNVVKGSDTLVLDHLSPDAAGIKDTALYVLRGLGAEDQSRISLAQVRSIQEVQTRVSNNGDGIVTAATTSDEALKQLITDILAVLPGAKDKSGETGVDQATVAAFGKARDQALAWSDAAAATKKWGDGSVDMARHIKVVQAKVDEFFLQSRMVAAQPQAADRFKIAPEKIEALMGDATALKAALDVLPVATPDGSGVLTWSALLRGTAYESMVKLAEVAKAALGDKAAVGLTEADWGALVGDAGGIVAWADAEASHGALKLGADRLRAITADNLAALDKLCQDDAAVSDTLARVSELERLVLYQRWLFELANNFIAMPALYSSDKTAIFEQGELILAGRNFPFSTLVESRGAHAATALQSSCFLMYVQIASPGKTFEVCVPVTAGTSDGLYVGKRGVFRTLEGVEMDATVVHVITNPVSIYEAITSPFNRIVTFIESRIQSWADSANADFDKQVNANLDTATAKAAEVKTAATTATEKKDEPAAAAPAAAAPSEGVSPAMLVGAGSIIGSIGLVVGSVIGALAGLSVFQLLMAIVGLLAIIAAPFAALAWLKLRRRNLSAVLEAAGWALNERLKLTRQLGLLFTFRPPRPAGSELDWVDGANTLTKGLSAESEEDPEEAKSRRKWRNRIILLVILVVLWQTGLLQWLAGLGTTVLPSILS